MNELLDAIDACIVAAREDTCCEALVQPGARDMLVPPDLWEKLCVERSKIEDDAPELKHSEVPRFHTREVAPGVYQCLDCRKVDTRKLLMDETCDRSYGNAETNALIAMMAQQAVTRVMTPNVFRDVQAFLAIGHPQMLAPHPAPPEFGTDRLCMRLVQEELQELAKAWAKQDIVEIADGCADLIWVTLCLAFAWGIPIDKVWAEVARTNMAKFPGGVVTRRPEDGKIQKPEGWQPPNIGAIIAAALSQPEPCATCDGRGCPVCRAEPEPA